MPRSCGLDAQVALDERPPLGALLLRDARVSVARAGRRARTASFTLKKFTSRVRPGVLLTRANFLRCTSRLSSDDLPTFDRPPNATSGQRRLGTPAARARHAAEELQRPDHERFARRRRHGRLSSARRSAPSRPSKSAARTSASASTSSIVFTGWNVTAAPHFRGKLVDVAHVLMRDEHVPHAVAGARRLPSP